MAARAEVCGPAENVRPLGLSKTTEGSPRTLQCLLRLNKQHAAIILIIHWEATRKWPLVIANMMIIAMVIYWVIIMFQVLD